MSEKEKIGKRLVKARAALLAAVEGLDAAEWEWRPDDGRWSVRLTLAHVAAAQWSHLEVAQRLVAGQPVEIPGFDLDRWNEAEVARRQDWPVDRVLADLEAAQQATLAFLDEVEAGGLAASDTHPALGEVSVGQVLRIVAVHDNMHRRDVAKLLDEMP